MDILDRSVARSPQAPLDPTKLPFGRTFAPNMFMVDWDEGKGWHDPQIVPYGPLNLGPAAMVLHYGQEIFEGLKAFTQPAGSVHLFRPDRNAARLNTSAGRMCMPEIPAELQLEARRKIIRIDKGWEPPPPSTLDV